LPELLAACVIAILKNADMTQTKVSQVVDFRF
jgi:hypothetical protein